jgi:transposase
MIDQERRTAVQTLYNQGVNKKQIAAMLKMDIKTIRAILDSDCNRQHRERQDSIDINDAVLEKLYRECDGYIQRIHEILTEEHNIVIGYSTLTRLLRNKGIGEVKPNRSSQVPDLPGDEMQHDTTVYQLQLGSQKHKIVCSGLYLRYSKLRYIKFYRHFNRFTMKCFLDEALKFWVYCPKTCVIDNTNLAVLYRSGSQAVFNPEMVAFANNYGFSWKAHAINHPDRKAGTERNFWTVETNFLPGRKFESMQDLNSQALDWATDRYAKRPHSKTKLIPLELFEIEKTSLQKLPDFISPPYLQHTRLVDQYGYISFNANFYWIPETVRVRNVTVLQFANELRILDGTHEITRYKTAPEDVVNMTIAPEGCSRLPRFLPNNRKIGCEEEEKILRTLGDVVVQYIDMIHSPQSGIKQCHAFIRSLYRLYRRWGHDLFVKTIERAHSFNVNTLRQLETIAGLLIKENIVHGGIDIDSTDDYQNRKEFLEGRFSEEQPFDLEP